MCILKKPILAVILTGIIIIAISCKEVVPVTDFVGFEDIDLDASGYWNGSDGSGGFTSGNLFFVNHYDNQYLSWRGFAVTNHTDTNTAEYSNQYSSITGSGADESEKYAVYYYLATPDTLTFDAAEKITSISLCNSTYSYLSIRDGNSFCKKFGGDSGNDPDWFKLTLTGINAEGNATGYVDIYLADFRFDDNANDYISNVWTNISLSNLGYIKGLVFEMSSSDSGEWGMNNPAYVCIDNITGELETNE